MKDREKLKKEIKELYDDVDTCITLLITGRADHNDVMVTSAQNMMESIVVQTQQVLSFILDSLPEEPTSKDLEEAAKESGQRHFPDEYNIWVRPNYEAKHAELAFKEGANWQKENDILIFKHVYADLLSAKGYNIVFVNSEINRLEKELSKED